jgi:hypothetical protein
VQTANTFPSSLLIIQLIEKSGLEVACFFGSRIIWTKSDVERLSNEADLIGQSDNLHTILVTSQPKKPRDADKFF